MTKHLSAKYLFHSDYVKWVVAVSCALKYITYWNAEYVVLVLFVLLTYWFKLMLLCYLHPLMWFSLFLLSFACFLYVFLVFVVNLAVSPSAAEKQWFFYAPRRWWENSLRRKEEPHSEVEVNNIESQRVCLHNFLPASPPRHHLSYDGIVWRLRGKIIRTVLCFIQRLCTVIRTHIWWTILKNKCWFSLFVHLFRFSILV